MTEKGLIVKPPKRFNWDLGDILAIARSEGKRLFKTRENVRVVWIHDSPYGFVVVVQHGCSQGAGCKQKEKKM